MITRHPIPVLLLTTCTALLVLLFLLAGNRSVQASQVAPHSAISGSFDPQQTLTGTRPVSATQLTPVEAQPVVTVTVVVTVTATPLAVTPPAATPGPADKLPVVPLQADEVLTGTVVLNRSEDSVFFFLDNDLYELPPNRATGLTLARQLAGLTLFSCPAAIIEDPTCDWVSYPIRRAALYQISADSSAPGPGNLYLAVVGPPPLPTTWIQNRTGAVAQVLRDGELLVIENTGVLALDVAENQQAVLHIPHCLQTTDRRICEWLPTSFAGGVFYALREIKKAAGINGVSVARGALEPLVEQEVVATPTPTPTPTPEPVPKDIFCTTQIPALNVRSGPGTDFLILGKLQAADKNSGRVLVVGRTNNGEWLAVDPSFIPGGWMANVAQWLSCDGEIDTLPVAEISDGRRPAAPVATPVVAPSSGAAEATPTPEAAAPTPTAAAPQGLGEGQALLIATNAFDHPIRFTLDAALHGLPSGSLSEYDLEPGQSVEFIIRAGRVQFSVSTAWRGGAGNAEFEMAEGATQELLLHFVPSVTNPDLWEMRYFK